MNPSLVQLQLALQHAIPASKAAGVETSLRATWSMAPAVGLLIVLVTAAVVLLIYWHERDTTHKAWRMLLACIRAAIAAVTVLMLYGWIIEVYRTERADLVIVIDDSASMSTVDTFDNRALATNI